MDKTLILPPLVRGNVMGFLDFFIDEVRIFRNLLILTDKFDVVAQVQWWGEISPTYIRPAQLHILRNGSQRTELLKAYIYSARYEVKTKLELFKSYLKACEVVEVSVLEAVENYVIGSAFLKDLISLLNSNEVTTPIFNYMGEEIGEVKLHIIFAQNDKKVDRNLLKKNIAPVSRKIQSSNKMCYDSLPTKREIVKVSYLKESCECLPEIETVYDSSKVLYFDLGIKHNSKTEKHSVKQPNKFNINSIKCKSKVNRADKVGAEVSHQSTKEKQVPEKISSNQENQKKSNRQDMPSRGLSQTKVLDYLLGCQLSKEDEESAISDFIKMSPSCNFVSSINQLCLSSDFLKSKSNNGKGEINSLRFDLSNPIERKYYKRFFADSNDFEVAEFLNQPENRSLSKEKQKSIERVEDREKTRRDSHCEENNFPKRVNEKRRNGCPRCKYYKKLDELDTIIESLKHFEERILTREKDAEENSRCLLEKNIFCME